VLVDWIPNSPRALTVTPYSLRAAHAPYVSSPVGWEEVEAAADGVHGLRFEPHDVLERVHNKGDLFRPVLELRQRLPKQSAAP
jgi:bifunctional non-homologous end joining protein LigD